MPDEQLDKNTSTEHPLDADVTAVETENGISYVLDEFLGGPTKGMKYHTPQALSIDAAVEKYGSKVALDAINDSLSSKNRTRQKNAAVIKIDEAEKKKEDFAATLTDGVLFSVDEAKKWVPGTREISANGLFKKAVELQDLANAETDPVKKAELNRKKLELVKKASQLVGVE